MNLKAPEKADIGYRSTNALLGSGAEIVIPRDSQGPIEFERDLVEVVNDAIGVLSNRVVRER